MNKRLVVLVVMMIAVLVASNHQVKAQSDSIKSEEQISTRSVKITYVEDLESKKGVADAELCLAYKNPTTELFTILSAITDNEGSVTFDIPGDDEGNSWSFAYGSLNDTFKELMNLQKEGKDIKIQNFRLIRVPKSTEKLEIILDGNGRMSTIGSLQIWY